MKEFFWKKTIRFKLGSIIAGLIVMMVVILGSFLYIYSSIDMNLVDLSGRQRMLLQKFAKEFFTSNVIPAQVRHSSLKAASDISLQITADRAKYTASIIKVKKELKGFTPDRNWAGVKGAVPLPATFVQEVSNDINKNGNYRYDLISKWNVNRAKGLKTDFEKEAFDAIERENTKPYYRFEEYGGKFVLRYATADVASTQGCVKCHNSMPDSPKKDYKLGDLMGILVVTVPVTDDIALGKSMFLGGAGLDGGGGGKPYEKTAKVFEQTLNGLMYGGKVPLDLDMTKFRTVSPPENRDILAALKDVAQLWKTTLQNAEVIKNADVNSSEYLKGILAFEKSNAESLDKMNEVVKLMSKTNDARLYGMVFLLITLIGAAIALGVFGWFLITKIVVRPVNKVVAMAKAISEGDLTGEDLDIKSYDEMGALGTALDKMKRNLNSTIGRLQATSDSVASASTQLDTTASEIAKGMSTQSSQTDQVASAMEVMNTIVTEVARNSQNAAESANATQNVAKQGGVVVNRAVEGMTKVLDTVKNSASTVETLSRSSQQIGDIVAVINDIADQTNLLALNAAIEAARAGEQGRGFAVVADEVRSLAEKTTKATKEIADMIKNIQDETMGAMASMHEGTRQAEQGMQLSNEAGESLKEIVGSVVRVADMVAQIATASEEQNVTTEEIATNVTGIAGVAKKTAADINCVTDATRDLSKIAVELKNIVDGFKISRAAPFAEQGEHGLASDLRLAGFEAG